MEQNFEPVNWKWSLLGNDRLHDGKSLVWENNTLAEIKDEADTDNRTEGRMGEFRFERIKTHMGTVIFFPVVKLNQALLEEQNRTEGESFFDMRNETRILRLERFNAVAADSVQADLDASCYLRKLFLEADSENCDVYEGLMEEADGKRYLGTKVLICGKEGEFYVFTYAGMGNYTDIKMERDVILKRLIRTIKRG